MSMNSNAILEVVFATPLRKRFDYILPTDYTDENIVGCRVMAPFGAKHLTGLVVALKTNSEFNINKLKPVISRIDSKPILKPVMMRLALWASRYYHHSLGDICFSMLAIKYRQTEPFQLPQMPYWSLVDPAETINLRGSAKKQRECLDLLAEHPSGLSSATLREAGISATVVKNLSAKGYIASRQIIMDELANVEMTTPLTLTIEQQAAMEAIELTKFQVSLINGVTGSGKTEIYIRCIKQILDAGKQALLLVPEIGLTPQTASRFKQRLKYPVTLIHSGLNATEQTNYWSLCTLDTPRLVIATRSGLFAPLEKLGIIVVDEEHDMSYKQAAGWLYSARDLAVMRASQSDIPILLGSATPSLESLQHARRGNYNEVILSERATKQTLPSIKLLDIRKLPMQQGMSKPLLDLMANRLQQGEQILVFINRRGYAPVLMCHDCGWLAECQRCHSHYTLHRAKNLLRCHHCDARRQVPTACPDCHSGNITAVGAGTERLEEFLQHKFPDHAMVRIDRDSTRQKHAMQTYIRDIKDGKYQILIGTQMLAKGHHFPSITLVVIVDMDGALFCSDFRAVERFGQLMTQVSGRAGRGDKPGQIVLQTRQPDHPHITTLVTKDYRQFSENLLRERKMTQWPPYSHLAVLKAQAVKEHHPINFITELKKHMHITAQAHDVALLGPVPATQLKKAGKFNYQLLLQSQNRKSLHLLIESMLECIEDKKLAKSVRWTLDVDPLEMV